MTSPKKCVSLTQKKKMEVFENLFIIYTVILGGRPLRFLNFLLFEGR
jgi:hypothetical protein